MFEAHAISSEHRVWIHSEPSSVTHFLITRSHLAQLLELGSLPRCLLSHEAGATTGIWSRSSAARSGPNLKEL